MKFKIGDTLERLGVGRFTIYHAFVRESSIIYSLSRDISSKSGGRDFPVDYLNLGERVIESKWTLVEKEKQSNHRLTSIFI